MSKNKTIVDVRVKDIEKWRYPSKHYVYVLEVTWSEGTKTIIYRRYSRFFEFQCKLLEKFPEEGGIKDPTERMIPFLPGKKLFGRSNIRKVAMERKKPIDEYCRQLIRLPPKLSDSDFVIEFFEVTEEDINPQKEKLEKKNSNTCDVISDPVLLERYVAMSDYQKQGSNQCSLTAGQVVEVVEKNQHGWWFITCTDNFSEGWVPANFLEPYDKETEENLNEVLSIAENHITTNSYEAQNADELSFEKGVVVKVFEKQLDGWWKVSYQGSTGYVPAIFLELYDHEVDESKEGATYAVATVEDAVKQTVAKQNRSKDDSDKPNQTHSHKRRGSDSGPTRRDTEPQFQSKVVFAGVASSQTKQSKPRKGSLSPPRTSSSTASKTAATTRSTVSGSQLSSKVSSLQSHTQPSRPQPPRPQRPPRPVKQSSHEAIYSTITAPPPRKNSVKKMKEKPKPKPLIKSRPLPTPVNTEVNTQETTPGQPVKHFYEDIDDVTPEFYRTIAAFSSQAGDGLSFDDGVVVELISQNSSGWWYVLLGNDEGWVPSSYLERCDPPNAPPQPVPSKAPTKDLASDLNNAICGSQSPTTQPRENSSTQSKKTPSTSTQDHVKEPPLKPKPHHIKTATDRKNTQPPALKPRVDRSMSSKEEETISSSRRDPPRPPVENRISNTPNVPQSKTAVNELSTRREPPSPASKSGTKPSIHDRPKPPGSSSTLSSAKAQPPKPRPRAATKQDQSSNVSSELAAFLAKRSGNSDIQHKPVQSFRDPKPVPVITNGSGTQPSLKPKARPVPATTLSNKPQRPSDSPKPQRPSDSPKPRPSRPQQPSKKPQSGAHLSVNGSESRRPPPRPPTSPALKKKSESWVSCESYISDGQDCLSFEKGAVVEEIVEKAGEWWFVQIGGEQGWVPSTYFEKTTTTKTVNNKPSRPALPSKSFYVSLADFEAKQEGSVPLSEGERVEVLEECEDGWWRVIKSSGVEGWVPATFLEKQ